MKVGTWLLLVFLGQSTGALAGSWLDGGQLRGHLPMTTWVEQRDRDIEKQDLEYSCGAASLATLMQSWLGIPVGEQEILELLPAGTVAASLQKLADLAENEWNLRVTGLALDFATLQRLRIPALVYLEVRGGGHFSVLRGVDESGRVWLADPSWGNRLFTESQFRTLWETREHRQLKGRILLLQPGPGTEHHPRADWFRRAGLRQDIRRSSCRNCRAGLL